jgi:hypothetical protein
MSDKKVVDQVKKIVLYGIAVKAKRTEFLNMPEYKKHEIDRQDSAQKADDMLNSFFEKDSGRNLIPSDQSMDKRLQK